MIGFRPNYVFLLCSMRVADTNSKDILPSDIWCGVSPALSVFSVRCRMSHMAHTLCVCVGSEALFWTQPPRSMARLVTLARTVCCPVSTVSFVDIPQITLQKIRI